MRPSFWTSPGVLSALLTAGAFCLLLFVLRPGYWINDDVKIAWNIAGYPGGGDTVPFLIHNNILLGLMLAPLYALRTSANWYVYLLIVLNACATGSLLWLALAAKRPTLAGIIGCSAILLAVVALTINVTYTMTAFLATVTGVLLLWASARVSLQGWMLPAACGCLLVFASSLLRIPMLLMGLLLTIPMLAGSWRSLNTRRLFALSAAAVLLVLFGYAFNRLYVRASPDWNRFYAYTDIRQQLHDSHRLNNVHNEIRRVGWTPNDQELFAHWFYPDEQKFSYEKLQYLVHRVPPASRDLWGSVGRYLRQLTTSQHAPYLMWMVAIVASILAVGAPRKALVVVLLTWAIALGANLILTVIYKDPDYVLAGSLAGSVALSIVYLMWSWAPSGAQGTARAGSSPTRRRLATVSLTLFLLGGVALLSNLVTRSSINIARQRDYARFRADLEALQRDGILVDEALIVSPAHGLPYEWAPPLTLDLPSPPYLDTGWITFSPAYNRVLDAYGITSLPEALVSKENIYLMVESSFTAFLSRYYEERGDPPVRFESLYEMRASPGLLHIDPIHLYKLSGVR
jgi:hypothetical protein